MSEATIYSLDKSRHLSIGETLPNGALVIAVHQIIAGGDGLLPTWVALCYLPNDNYSRYAVWNVALRDEVFQAHFGDYYGTISHAVRGYESRAGISTEKD